MAGAERRRRYRFGFILSTLLGNRVRYANLRKYSASDDEVDCVWAPVRHYYLPDEKNPVAALPEPFKTRAVVLSQAWPVLGNFNSFDAIMIHQFETLSVAAALTSVHRRPAVIAAQDNPPIVDPDTYPQYPEDRLKPAWRSRVRLWNDTWAIKRAGHFLGFSNWAADIAGRAAELTPAKIAAIHVGLDLEQWPAPTPREANSRPQLLFVGGDFERKGGGPLLALFAERYSHSCDLHIVTQTPVPDLPPNAQVYHGLQPGSERLLELYHRSDVFVLPTIADLSPWVCLEAMASGCAVAASGIGGIPDMVSADCGMLFKSGDTQDMIRVLDRLTGDEATRTAMGPAGRRRVEAHFDAARNVPAIMRQMKLWADARAAGR